MISAQQDLFVAAAAARNGALTVINHADYKATNFLGIYNSYTTIVYGD